MLHVHVYANLAHVKHFDYVQTQTTSGKSQILEEFTAAINSIKVAVLITPQTSVNLLIFNYIRRGLSLL